MNYKRNYLSFSALKSFGKSANHYIQYVTKPVDNVHMAFGRAVHTYVLEGSREYHALYATSPKDIDRRTKAGKEAFSKFTESVGDRQVVSHTDYELIRKLHYSVFAEPTASGLLDGAVDIEKLGEGMISDVPFKGYADAVGEGWVADLKTTQDASPAAFQRECHNNMYHLQAAIYRRLFSVDRFYWICVEKKAPYNVCVYQQSDRAAKIADQQLLELVKNWKAWDGDHQSYAKEVVVLDLPRWA